MDMFGDDIDNESVDDFEHIEDKNVLLSNRPKSSGVICFHSGTEAALFVYIEQHARRNDPDHILSCIDRFCYSRHWMMHIGDQKSKHLLKAVADTQQTHPDQPLVCLELGSYCGYSSVLIAKDLNQGSFLYSIEYDIKCVEWTRRMLEYAGLSHKVQVIHGSCDNAETIRTLQENIASGSSQRSPIGLVFIDHDKDKYLSDLLILESLNIMRRGCIVVADNVMCFGNPSKEYLQHVRESGMYSDSQYYQSYVEYTVPISTDDPDIGSTAVRDELVKAQSNNKHITSLIDGVEISVYK